MLERVRSGALIFLGVAVGCQLVSGIDGYHVGGARREGGDGGDAGQGGTAGAGGEVPDELEAVCDAYCDLYTSKGCGPFCDAGVCQTGLLLDLYPGCTTLGITLAECHAKAPESNFGCSDAGWLEVTGEICPAETAAFLDCLVDTIFEEAELCDTACGDDGAFAECSGFPNLCAVFCTDKANKFQCEGLGGGLALCATLHPQNWSCDPVPTDVPSPTGSGHPCTPVYDLYQACP